MKRRIVEIEADLGEKGWRYGSGLVIGDRTVLTAAHVVLDVAEVTVRGTEQGGRGSWSSMPSGRRSRSVRLGARGGQ